MISFNFIAPQVCQPNLSVTDDGSQLITNVSIIKGTDTYHYTVKNNSKRRIITLVVRLGLIQNLPSTLDLVTTDWGGHRSKMPSPAFYDADGGFSPFIIFQENAAGSPGLAIIWEAPVHCDVFGYPQTATELDFYLRLQNVNIDPGDSVEFSITGTYYEGDAVVDACKDALFVVADNLSQLGIQQGFYETKAPWVATPWPRNPVGSGNVTATIASEAKFLSENFVQGLFQWGGTPAGSGAYYDPLFTDTQTMQDMKDANAFGIPVGIYSCMGYSPLFAMNPTDYAARVKPYVPSNSLPIACQDGKSIAYFTALKNAIKSASLPIHYMDVPPLYGGTNYDFWRMLSDWKNEGITICTESPTAEQVFITGFAFRSYYGGYDFSTTFTCEILRNMFPKCSYLGLCNVTTSAQNGVEWWEDLPKKSGLIPMFWDYDFVSQYLNPSVNTNLAI